MRQLDAALEDASPGFRQANANFARSSRDLGAIGAGRDAFLRGRTEDTIPAFSGSAFVAAPFSRDKDEAPAPIAPEA